MKKSTILSAEPCRGWLASMALRVFDRGTLAYLRGDLHFWPIRIVNALTFQSWRVSSRARRLPQPRFLNLGCGPQPVNSSNWINIDGTRAPGVDVIADFRHRLPFGRETFDGIFTQHVLEHFSLSDGIALLRECYRVLCLEGILRIVVPDGRRIMQAYFADPDELMRRRDSFCAMAAVNLYFRQGHEHRCLHDEELLSAQLKAAGFEHIVRSSFGKTACAGLALDDSRYLWESIYVEAVKRERTGVTAQHDPRISNL